jgi:hypothetical protein
MKIVFSFLLSLVLTFSLGAQEPFVTHFEILWGEGKLIIDITGQLSPESNVLPENRLKAERAIDRSLATRLREQIFNLQLNSRFSVQEWIEARPDLFRALEQFRNTALKEYTTTGEDAQTLTVRYSLEIFPSFIELFVNHQEENPVPKTLRWQATRAFSGLVVFVPRPLRKWGEAPREATLVQALFPRIYYQKDGPGGEIALLWSVEMLKAPYLNRWGMVAYQEGFAEETYLERIGTDPMRIMARHLYGTSPTDVLIDEDDALKILSSPQNRVLLSEGRVLFLLEPMTMEDSEP